MSAVSAPLKPPVKSRIANRRADLAQWLVVGLVAAAVAGVAATTATNLRTRGIPLGVDFLFQRAGFSVAETLLPYDPGDSVLRAMVVGIANTLFVSAVVVLTSTFLGVFLGIARLSRNPLVGGLAKIWVEGVRNTPPILLLIFIYTLWWRLLPNDHTIQIAPGVLASIRGLGVPKVQLPWALPELVALLLLSAAAVGLAWNGPGLAARLGRRRARLALAGAALPALAAATAHHGPFAVALPAAVGADIRSGAILTPELFTILFGLTIYTTGFIAEIVRGGINAVPIGQWEAARALGFSEPLALRLVILPQMLRVIVPPMNSQYINVVKNSTLALAIGYTDFLTIMGTVINKTSHAVEGTVMIVLVYLAINLSLSAALNAYNHRVAAKER
jgi:general L-amino acid transport system permease protein